MGVEGRGRAWRVWTVLGFGADMLKAAPGAGVRAGLGWAGLQEAAYHVGTSPGQTMPRPKPPALGQGDTVRAVCPASGSVERAE